MKDVLRPLVNRERRDDQPPRHDFMTDEEYLTYLHGLILEQQEQIEKLNRIVLKD